MVSSPIELIKKLQSVNNLKFNILPENIHQDILNNIHVDRHGVDFDYTNKNGIGISQYILPLFCGRANGFIFDHWIISMVSLAHKENEFFINIELYDSLNCLFDQMKWFDILNDWIVQDHKMNGDGKKKILIKNKRFDNNIKHQRDESYLEHNIYFCVLYVYLRLTCKTMNDVQNSNDVLVEENLYSNVMKLLVQ